MLPLPRRSGRVRRLAMLSLLAALCVLLFSPCPARAQDSHSDTEDSAPAFSHVLHPRARLALNLDPSRDRAVIDLDVLSLRQSPGLKRLTQQRLQEALEKALGGPIHNVSFIPDLSAGSDNEDSSEASADSSHSHTSPLHPEHDTIVPWMLHAECGGRAGAIPRRLFLQSGQIDTAPLFDILRSVGNNDLSLKILLWSRGAPVAAGSGQGLKGLTGKASQDERIRRADRTSIYSAHISLPIGDGSTALPATPVYSFAVGYAPGDAVKAFLPPLAVFVASFVVVLVLRWRALRAMQLINTDESSNSGDWTENEREDALSAIRFGFVRLLNTGLMGFSLAWIGVMAYSDPASPLLWSGNILEGEATAAVPMLICMIPIAAICLLAIVSARPILFQIGSEPVSISDILSSTGIALALQIIPILFVLMGFSSLLFVLPQIAMLLALIGHQPAAIAEYGVWFFSDSHFWRWGGWFALWYLSRQLLTSLNIVSHPTTKITSGGLYDHVMAMADSAGVKIKNVIYASTGSLRTANASATSTGAVIFTDRLLELLTIREVNAVAAHEIAHLKYRHPQKQVWLQLLPFLTIVTVIALPFLLPVTKLFLHRYEVLVMAAGVVGSTLFQLWVSRRWERIADREAARLGGDPAALITGLARIRQASGLPQDWGRRDARLFTHPSNLQRVENLREAGFLTGEEADSLIQSDAERQHKESLPASGDHYFAPKGFAKRRVLSPAVRARHALKMQWQMRAIFALTPLPFLVLASTRFPYRLEFTHTLPQRILLYAAAGLLTLAAFLLQQIRHGSGLYHSWLPLLRARFLHSGALTAAEIDSFDCIAICLSPGPYPRLYGSSFEWDCGYLLLEPHRLSFLGELTAFSIDRASLREPASCLNSPGLFGVRRILLSWTATPETMDVDSASPKTFAITIRPAASPNLLRQHKDTALLISRLQAWCHIYDAATGEALPVEGSTRSLTSAPDFENVGGLSLQDVVRIAKSYKAQSGNLLTVLTAGIFANLPLPAILYMLVFPLGILFTELQSFQRLARQQAESAESSNSQNHGT